MQPSDPLEGEVRNDADVIAAGGTLRFNVSDGTRRSVTWRVWTKENTNDIYAAAREAAGHIKISMHESGSWQHGFISNERAEGFRLPGQSRHFAIWPRPAELLPGWTCAVRIIIPDASLQARPCPGTQRKPVVDIVPMPESDATLAEIWLESVSAPTPPPLRGAQLAGRLSQPSGDTVRVVAYRLALPWDPYRRFSEIVRTAHSMAIRKKPDWTGDPPLSICLHDPDDPMPELVLCELAVPALI